MFRSHAEKIVQNTKASFDLDDINTWETMDLHYVERFANERLRSIAVKYHCSE